MERACVLCRGDRVTPEHLPPDIFRRDAVPVTTAAIAAREPESLALHPQLEALEKALIAEALEHSGNNKAAAARLLEISERALWYKIKRYGL